MDDKSKEETDHLVTNHGVDAATKNNTQEGNTLFDTLCHDAAVVTLSPQTHNDVALPGTPQGLSATINACDTPHLLDFHHLLLENIALPVVERHIWKPKKSNK